MAGMNIPGVEYRDVVGFSGYKVGSDGSVWSCWRTNGEASTDFRRLRGSRYRRGYLRVTLGRRTRKCIHHLVLEAFVGPCPSGMVACHFPDTDPSNNSVNNLRWDTQAGNMCDRELCGNTMRGDSHARAILTSEVVRKCRVMASDGESIAHIARLAGVSDVVMGQAVRGETWKEAGGPLIVPSPPLRIGGRTVREWATHLGLADATPVYKSLSRGTFYDLLERRCPQCDKGEAQ
jgi:hypothetical protein